jgi:hypothetical protein
MCWIFKDKIHVVLFPKNRIFKCNEYSIINLCHLDPNCAEDKIENIASRLGKYIRNNTIAEVSFDWENKTPKDYMLTIHFTTNMLVYRDGTCTNEITKAEGQTGWTLSNNQCPKKIYG